MLMLSKRITMVDNGRMVSEWLTIRMVNKIAKLQMANNKPVNADFITNRANKG